MAASFSIALLFLPYSPCAGVQLVKAAAGFVRIEVESALSRGGRAGNAGGFHVVGGNYFSAQPVGVRNGVDYGCTGEVRKVEADRIRCENCVYSCCLPYSSTSLSHAGE